MGTMDIILRFYTWVYIDKCNSGFIPGFLPHESRNSGSPGLFRGLLGLFWCLLCLFWSLLCLFRGHLGLFRGLFGPISWPSGPILGPILVYPRAFSAYFGAIRAYYWAICPFLALWVIVYFGAFWIFWAFWALCVYFRAFGTFEPIFGTSGPILGPFESCMWACRAYYGLHICDPRSSIFSWPPLVGAKIFWSPLWQREKFLPPPLPSPLELKHDPPI